MQVSRKKSSYYTANARKCKYEGEAKDYICDEMIFLAGDLDLFTSIKLYDIFFFKI